MPVPHGQTIVAVSSGSGAAAVAVIRVSGPDAQSALRQIAGAVPEPRRAWLRTLRHPTTGEMIDRALVLWFPGPRSATGEDLAEFQVHGGRAVVHAALDALLAVPGVVPAEAGAFTRRALTNGRMDLAEVEGLADLISADTEGQRKLAFAHAFGHLGDVVEEWRGRLVRAMALIEAGIDFAEEDDVPAGARALARPEVVALDAALEAALEDRRGRLIRDGATIAIAGRPNAGKSSLLNALAARDVAIVSDEPGTTRDVIEVSLDLGGQKVTLLDTAGLREAAGAIEAEGIRRARDRIATADLVLWIRDGAAPDADRIDIDSAAEHWLVINKSDLGRPAPDAEAGAFMVSAATGEGLDTLLAALTSFVSRRAAGGDHPALIRERHRSNAAAARAHLQAALSNWDDLSDEILAEELRLASTALGRITGAISTDDLLDVVFREFCIGK